MGTGNSRHEAPRRPQGRAYSLAAFTLALLGLVMFPPGGLTAIVCGALARSRGDHALGVAAIAAGVVSFIASFFVAAWVLD